MRRHRTTARGAHPRAQASPNVRTYRRETCHLGIEHVYAADVIGRTWLERRPDNDEGQLRAYVWDTRSTGLLLADESGAVVRAGPGDRDPADGFVTAAILLRERVREGEWPDRPSHDSTDQLGNAQMPARPSVQRRSPSRSGLGLGTLAERARRARSKKATVASRALVWSRVMFTDLSQIGPRRRSSWQLDHL
jgi:hypothetical protein